MKRDRKSRKEKTDHKVELSCPFFKRYYTGICAGHKLPYAPTSKEKMQYCLADTFRLCTIYGESTSKPEKK